MVDGASRTRVFTKITVPLALPAICSRGGYRLGACTG